MLTVYTWHGKDFDLKSDTIDQSKSQYIRSIPNYLHKIEVLNQIVGSNLYLWAFLNSSQHKKYEICKSVEWVLEIEKADILGYVNTPIWENFLQSKNHKDQDLRQLFQQEVINHIDQSILVRHPIESTKIKRKRTYKINNTYDVTMIDETIF